MTVSVIIPNYNHAPFLRQRIESILNQTFQDFELILLDDCSTDNSRDILGEYRDNPHVSHVVYNTVNGGSPFKQWEKGVELAQGEWIWIAESDDWAEDSFLELMLQAAGENPRCVLCSSIPIYVYPSGNKLHKEGDGEIRFYQGCDFACQHLMLSNPLPNVSALLIRRDVVRQIDFSMADNMRLCGDWLLYSMLCEKGGVAEYSGALSYFRQHGDSTSAEAEKKGLSLIEGVKVLDFLTKTFNVSSKAYAKEWGREWAKKERKYSYDRALKKKLIHIMRNYPSIRFWHKFYQLRLWLK